MTGMHAIHMIVGLGLLTYLVVQAKREYLHCRILLSGRNDRPLLALRRYRLDFPVPATLSDWTSRMSAHVAIPKRQHTRKGLGGLDRSHGCDERRFLRRRWRMEHCFGVADRGDQGFAGGLDFHGCQACHDSDQVVCSGRFGVAFHHDSDHL